MRKIILGISLIALLAISANAQYDSALVEKKFDQLEQQIQQLQENNKATQNEIQALSVRENSLKKNINGLSKNNKALSSRLDSLNKLLKENSNAVTKLNEQLTEQIQDLSGQISETRETTSKSVTELDDALSKNTLYWIVAVFIVALLSILAFFFLRKKVTDNENSVYEGLSSTKQELINEGLLIDKSMLEHLENQLKFIREELKVQPEFQNENPDHSLVLKVADEIERIEKNLERVEDQKRIKPLTKALERIRSNFQANGYEIVSLLNEKYDDRMSLDVFNFKVDENLNDGEKIISRVIKPQVKYNGILIQRGQVDVTQSE